MTDALAMCPRLALSFSPPASFSQVLGPQVCATLVVMSDILQEWVCREFGYRRDQ